LLRLLLEFRGGLKGDGLRNLQYFNTTCDTETTLNRSVMKLEWIRAVVGTRMGNQLKNLNRIKACRDDNGIAGAVCERTARWISNCPMQLVSHWMVWIEMSCVLSVSGWFSARGRGL
jgi:hypothetical protein